MKDEDKKKVEPIKDLKTLRKKREKSAVNNITERKQAEEKLQDSEEYLKMLFDYAPDAYYVNDLKGNFIDGNKAAERLTGYKREELIGKSFLKLKLLSLADIPKAAKLLVKNLRGQPTGPDELVLNRKDNSKVTVEISTYPVKIKGKTLILGIARDVTKRKQAEEKLSETKDSLSITRFNRAFENLSGYDVSEVIGKKIDILFSKNKMESALEYIQKTASGERWKTVEIEIRRKDGEPRIVLWNSANILDAEKDNIIATIAQGQDITERKQAEERIKHLNLVLRAIRKVNQLIVKEKDLEILLKGACNNLIKTRGYYNTWIALLDEEGKLKTYAEAGLGKAFLPMIELLKRGKLTTCSQKALKQQEVVITEDPASTCTECPLAQKYSGRAGFTIRLEHSGKVCGLISVSIPAHLAVDQEEQTLFKEVAEDIAFGLYHIELDEERKQAEENLKNAKDELQMIMNEKR
jgi:PAS domain S-box-containing protein